MENTQGSIDYFFSYFFLFMAGLLLALFVGSFFSLAYGQISTEGKQIVLEKNWIHSLPEKAVTKPIFIKIPSINLATDVTEMEYDYAKNQMQMPSSNTEVGWFKFSAAPGTAGSAILSGHYDTVTGAPAVFYHLGDLKQADTFFIKDEEGKEMKYIITNVASFPLNEFPKELIYNNPDYSQVVLLTCDGVWNPITHLYSHRLAVFARQDPGYE